MADSVWDLFVRLSADTSEFKHSMNEAAETVHGFQEKAEQLASFGEKLLLAEGLRELGVEALTAYGHIQKAQIALTALTGSAEETAHTIESLKEVALSDALSFPSLVQAQQRMVAFGFSAQQIPGALQAMADAAGATDKDFESVAASVERMGLSGTASGKQLAGLGLSVTDLAEVLGVADGEVKKVFKALEQDDRLEAVTLALQKFQGVGAEVAQGILGQWQNVGTQFHFVMEDIGKGIAPVVSEALGIVNSDILPFIRSLAEGFAELPAPVKDVAVGLALAATAATALAAAVAGLELVGFGAALGTVATAALAAGPWIVGVGAAVAALHFSGAAAEAADFADGLRRNLPGLADFVQPLIDRIKVALDLFHLLPNALPDLSHAPGLGASAGLSLQAGVALLGAPGSMASNFLGGTDPAMTAATGAVVTKLKEEMVALGESEEVATEVGGRSAASLLKIAAAATEAELGAKAAAAELAKMFSALGQENFALTLEKMESAFSALKSSLTDGQLVSAADKLESKLQDAFHAGAIGVDEFTERVEAIEATIADAAQAVQDALPKAFVIPGTMEGQFAGDPWGLIAFKENLGLIDAAQAKFERLAQAQKDAQDAIVNSQHNVLAEAMAINEAEQNINRTLAARGFTPEGLPPTSKGAQDIFTGMVSGGPEAQAMFAERDALLKRLHVQNQESVAAMIADNAKLQESNLYTDQQKLKSAINTNKAIYDEQAKFLLQEQKLQSAINLKALTGADSTKEIEQLEGLRLHIQAIADASTYLGKVYIGLRKDFNGAFDSLTKGIADNLIEWNDWEKTLLNIGKNIAKQFTETLLTGLFAPLKASLNESGGLFDALGKKITGAVGALSSKHSIPGLPKIGGGSVPGVGSGETPFEGGSLPGGSPGDFGGEVGIPDTVSVRSGGGGSLSGMMGGLSDLLMGANPIDIALKAITGIVSGIQGAQQVHLLGEIEVSTRQCKEQLVGGIQTALNTYLPELLHLPDIWGAINAVNDQLRYGLINVNVAEWGGGTANVPTAQIAADDTATLAELPAISPLGGMDTSQADEDQIKSNIELNALNQTYREGQPIFQNLALSAADASAALSIIPAGSPVSDMGSSSDWSSFFDPLVKAGGTILPGGKTASAPPVGFSAGPQVGTYSPDQIQSAVSQFASQLSEAQALRDQQILSQNQTIAAFEAATLDAHRQLLIGIAKQMGDTRVQDYITQAQGNLDLINWDAVQNMLIQEGGQPGGAAISALSEAAWAGANNPWSAFGDPSKLRSYAASPMDPNAMINQYYTRLSTAGMNYNGSTNLGGSVIPGTGPTAVVTVNALNQTSRGAAEAFILAMRQLGQPVR